MITSNYTIFGRRYGGGVITSGLIMNVDASDINSYDPAIGGTNWNDLTINNNDATLYNSPIFRAENGGALDFLNNSSIGATTSLPTELLGNPQFSVSGWFKSNGSNNASGTWGFGLVSTGRNNINSYMTITNEITISLANTCVFGTNEYYSTTQYKHITWVKRAGVFSRNNIDIYVNGVKKTGASLINRLGNETTNANILSGNGIAISKTNTILDNTQRASMRVAEFLVYNRAITESENLENFNNTKSKFGY